MQIILIRLKTQAEKIFIRQYWLPADPSIPSWSVEMASNEINYFNCMDIT